MMFQRQANYPPSSQSLSQPCTQHPAAPLANTEGVAVGRRSCALAGMGTEEQHKMADVAARAASQQLLKIKPHL